MTQTKLESEPCENINRFGIDSNFTRTNFSRPKPI